MASTKAAFGWKGGWIEGVLDLSYCTAKGATVLQYCCFSDRINLTQIVIPGLNLNNSSFPGLSAQGARFQGSLLLQNARIVGTVDASGANIGGQLDFSGSSLDGGEGEPGVSLSALYAQGLRVGSSMFLRAAKIFGQIYLSGARIGGQFDCDGATLNGGTNKEGGAEYSIDAQGILAEQDLFFLNVTAIGGVNIGGASVHGQVAFSGAKLQGGQRADGTIQDCIQAQGIRVREGVFLRRLTAKGEVILSGARIGGDLDCEGARFDSGEELYSTLKIALSGNRAMIKQSFIFLSVVVVRGSISLTAANVGDLVDDIGSWPSKENLLLLDGFTYDRIDGPISFEARRKWLETGSRWSGEFLPQPYTQLARTLRQMGHAAEARKVLIGMAEADAKASQSQYRERGRFARAMRWFSASEDKTTWAGVAERFHAADPSGRSWVSAIAQQFRNLHRTEPDVPGAPASLSDLTLSYARQDFRNQMRWIATKCRLAILWSYLKTAFLSLLVGHGYAPHRAILVLLGTVGLSALCFAYACCEGAMVPNSDVVLTSFSWWWSMQFDANAPTAGWTATGTATHYETFYALAYAFDVVVPLVDIGQKSAWSATTVTWLGWATRILTMALEVWGWIITALGAAAITGLVQRNQPD